MSRTADNNSSHVIRIDDYSIIICLAVTALMIFVTVLLANFYPVNRPEQHPLVALEPKYMDAENGIKKEPEIKKRPEAVVQATVPEIEKRIEPTVPDKNADALEINQKPVADIKKAEDPAAPAAVADVSGIATDKPKIRLVTIRGGRHDQYASIVFQFSDKIDFGQPRIEGKEVRFRLKHTETGLRPYRKYKTFDSWVRLETTVSDIDVKIGVPDNFLKLSAFLMRIPHRLVINLYGKTDAASMRRKEKIKYVPAEINSKAFKVSAKKKSKDFTGSSNKVENKSGAPFSRTGNRLKTIRGGRHEQYASIVFQFSDKIDFEKPRIEGAQIRFRLKDMETILRPYRKYKTFDSWVKLKKTDKNIDVNVGIPENFIKLAAFLMQSPPRLVINLYDR